MIYVESMQNVDKDNSVQVEELNAGQTKVRIFLDRTTGKFWTSGLADNVSYPDFLWIRRHAQISGLLVKN